jgi:transcriptional regulator with XRE-family HTH domain
MPTSDRYAPLREALIAARRERGLTQSEVAVRLGKAQSFVSKYESGERRLDVIEFIEVCQILGTKPASILRKMESEHD